MTKNPRFGVWSGDDDPADVGNPGGPVYYPVESGDVFERLGRMPEASIVEILQALNENEQRVARWIIGGGTIRQLAKGDTAEIRRLQAVVAKVEAYLEDALKKQ